MCECKLTPLTPPQIFAGLPSVLGRFIDRGTYHTSKMALKEWAGLQISSVAVWHAIQFLRAYISGTGPLANGLRQLAESSRGQDSPQGQSRPPHRREWAMAGTDYYVPTSWVCYVSKMLSANCILKKATQAARPIAHT